jgi:hypothetical protein
MLLLVSLLMVKNKVIIRAKTNMTHNKKIEALAKESLFSLVLSFSLKTIIALSVFVFVDFVKHKQIRSFRNPP